MNFQYLPHFSTSLTMLQAVLLKTIVVPGQDSSTQLKRLLKRERSTATEEGFTNQPGCQQVT